jgi:serine/threonine protein phosphatase PrpC
VCYCPQVIAEALTTDHNVSCCPESELERLRVVGAEVVERHLGVPNVEGMLQLTRSLGDAPFHRKGAVLHEPEMVRRPIEDSFLFVLAASDGLWDHFTNDEAVQFVHAELDVPVNAST